MPNLANLPITIKDIKKEYDLEVIRLWILSTHYRNPINFSDEILNQSKAGLERLYNAKERVEFIISKLNDNAENADELKLEEELNSFRQRFIEAMDDDFNTADALAAIFELVKFANTNVSEASSAEFAGALLDTMVKLCDVLGLKAVKTEEILDKEIEDLIAERQEARKAKNFARADEIRDELLAKGIILKDTREGVKWKRA